MNISKESANKRVSELSNLTYEMLRAGKWSDEVFNSEEYKKASDELDELLDYRKDMWPDDYDERIFAKVTDDRAHKFGEIGKVGYSSHNDVQLIFADGSDHYYHAMSLERVNSSPEIRAVFGEIPLSQYFKKRKEAK
jgi:hypothetical protein